MITKRNEKMLTVDNSEGAMADTIHIISPDREREIMAMPGIDDALALARKADDALSKGDALTQKHRRNSSASKIHDSDDVKLSKRIYLPNGKGSFSRLK